MSENQPLTEPAASLLAAVREMNRQKAQRDIKAFKLLRGDWAKWREMRMISERNRAPRHNLIRLLGFERSEVGLHSPFLGDLLDPDGSHGQGALFLRAFLTILERKLKETGHSLAGKDFHSTIPDVPESGDWNVVCEREKIDIRIYSPKAGLLVFIENKIGALEQEMQIPRYKHLLNRQRDVYPYRLVVGLSPRGYTFRTGDPDILITYEKDICEWLTEAEQQIASSAMRLRGNICQYRDVIESFNGAADMPNQELIDLIIKPENICCAWDIADVIPEVNNRLRCGFWRAVAERLNKELAGAPHAMGWIVAGLEETCCNPNTADVGVYLTSSTAVATLRVGVWQALSRGGMRVFHGVGFGARQPDPHPLNERLESLRSVLPDAWRSNAMNSNWIGWSWTNQNTDSREFLLSALTDADTLVQSVTTTVIGVLRSSASWQRFVDTNHALGALTNR